MIKIFIRALVAIFKQMKNIPIFDILFIIIIAIVFSVIIYFGHSTLITQFAVIFALISYFIGKFVAQIELRKKKQ